MNTRKENVDALVHISPIGPGGPQFSGGDFGTFWDGLSQRSTPSSLSVF